MARTKEFDTDEVLHKALQLFRSKGYNGSSMQEIVSCTGLSRSSIYDTFGDKHQLFVLALKKYKDDATGSMIKLLNETTDIKATLRDIFAFVVDMSLFGGPENNCLFTNAAIELAAFDEEVAAITQDNMRELATAVEDAITRQQQQQTIATVHTAAVLSTFIFTNISGIRVAGRSGADRASLEAIVEVVLSVL